MQAGPEARGYLAHFHRWLVGSVQATKHFADQHARGIGLLEMRCKDAYQLWHAGAVAVVANVNDYSVVVLESGRVKRLGIALKVAGAGTTTVQLLINGVASDSVSILAGARTATVDAATQPVVVQNDRLDYSVTAAGAGATDLMFEVGVA
jgi:hypothetical protein